MRKIRENRKNSILLHCILISIVVFLIYFQTMGFGFLYRDADFITGNPDLASLENVSELFSRPFPSNAPGEKFYRPLISLLWLFGKTLWDNKPAGFHVMNILFFLAASLLFYFLFLKISESGRTSLFAGLLFAAYPLHVESAAWITGGFGLFGIVCFAASFLTILRVNFGNNKTVTEPGSGKFNQLLDTIKGRIPFDPVWFPVVFGPVFFLLGCFSNEKIIFLPLALLLYDLLFLRRKEENIRWMKRGLFIYLPLVISAAAYLVVRFLVMKRFAFSFEASPEIRPFLNDQYSLISRVGSYIRIAVFPFNLTALHPLSGLTGVVVSVILILVVPAAALLLNRKVPAATFGLGFFLLGVLTIIVFPPGEIVAERAVLPASAGICLALGALLSSLSVARKPIWDSSTNLSILIIFALIFLAFVSRSFLRAGVWSSPVSLWESEADAHPDNGLVLDRLGNALYASGMRIAARKTFEESIKKDPDYFKSYHNLAALHIDAGNRKAAIEVINKAAASNYRKDADNFAILGLLYQRLGKQEESIKYFEQALETDSDNPVALYEMGNLSIMSENYQLAVDYLSRALQNPGDVSRAQILSNRATAYLRSGRLEKASDDLSEAMELAPTLAQPYLLAAEVEAKRQFSEKSIAILEEALETIPDPPFEIYHSLHELYLLFEQYQKAFEILYQYQTKNPVDVRANMAIGEFCLSWYATIPKDREILNTAITCFQNVLKVDPDNIPAMIQLGKTAVIAGNKEAARDIWNKVLEIDPDNRDAEKFIKTLKK